MNDGGTPVHIAVLEDKPECLRLLLEKGGDTETSLGSEGVTAIHLACYNGFSNIVRILIQFGADVNMPDNNGTTPILYAKAEDRAQIVYLLTQNGARNVEGDSGIFDDIKNKAGKALGKVVAETAVTACCVIS